MGSRASPSTAYNGFFYVENDERTCGIRVDSLTPVAEGARVNLSGYLVTVSGERRLKCLDVRAQL